MALLLSIETATPVCSVTLALHGTILASKESSTPNFHSSLLVPFIQELMESCNCALADLDAVAVSLGPGSYTGLRIGVSTAKGLCYALDIPLIGIPTLQGMAGRMVKEWGLGNSEAPGLPVLACPMIDARRMEVFCAVFDAGMTEVMSTAAVIIDENSFTSLLQDHLVVFAGTGAEKGRELLSIHTNACFMEGFQASSGDLIPLAEKRFTGGRFENLAYCEPFYLKDFVAGKPHVKGL